MEEQKNSERPRSRRLLEVYNLFRNGNNYHHELRLGCFINETEHLGSKKELLVINIHNNRWILVREKPQKVSLHSRLEKAINQILVREKSFTKGCLDSKKEPLIDYMLAVMKDLQL